MQKLGRRSGALEKMTVSEGFIRLLAFLIMTVFQTLSTNLQLLTKDSECA